MKILIVDDVDYIRKSIAKVLGDHNHECVCCENGAVAIKALQNEQFDLIITDIMMPDTDGFEFIDYVHDHVYKTKKIPIIAMSGGSKTINSDLALQMINEKTNEVLQKPFAKKDLLSCIERIMAVA